MALRDSDVEDIVRRILGGVGVTIAAQSEGDVVSNEHRILNFQGPGVTVTDNPESRRTDVYIPGSVVGGGITTSIYSGITAKALSLWTGSANTTPPANWETVAFSDAGWSAAVVATHNVDDFAPAGAERIWNVATAASQTDWCLFRTTFTLPATTINAAAITVDADDTIEQVWVNGTLISATWHSYTPGSPVSIPPSLLVTGTNVIAVWGKNNSPTALDNYAWVGYRLDLTTNSALLSSTVNGTLASNVACTTAGTYYDGPSVSLTAGTWVVTATVTTFNNTGGLTIATVKLWDGTTLFASTEMFEATAGQDYTHSLSAIITLSTTTTIKVSVRYNNNNGRIAFACANGGAPDRATQINALKVA